MDTGLGAVDVVRLVEVTETKIRLLPYGQPWDAGQTEGKIVALSTTALVLDTKRPRWVAKCAADGPRRGPAVGRPTGDGGEADLRRAIETAFVHCRPGGVAVFVPDCTRETFQESTDHGGNDDDDGRGVRYLEWSWDPDPTDTSTVTEYAFVLRQADGSIQVAHETHRLGLFGRDDWVRLLAEAGFDPRAVTEETEEDRTPRDIFVGHRPSE